MVEHAGEEHSHHDASDDQTGRGTEGMRLNEGGSEQEWSLEDVRSRAHEIYLRRGGAEGDPVADWLEAEQEIRGHSSAKRTPDDLNTARE